MAKNKVNRSQLIRDFKKKFPTFKPQALAEAIKKESGETIPPNYISMIISNSKKKKGTGKPGRPKGSTKQKSLETASKTRAASGMSIDTLLLAKKFVNEIGSVEKAKAAMQAYVELVG